MISAKYQLGFLLFIFLVNFQMSVTNLILSGLPSIIFSSFFFTEITSATNLTVADKSSLIFSYFSTYDSLIPINVNSDLIFSLFLSSIAFKKLLFIADVKRLLNFFVSPFAKEVRIVS